MKEFMRHFRDSEEKSNHLLVRHIFSGFSNYMRCYSFESKKKYAKQESTLKTLKRKVLPLGVGMLFTVNF